MNNKTSKFVLSLRTLSVTILFMSTYSLTAICQTNDSIPLKLDLTDYRSVSQFYCQNYYTGNYEVLLPLLRVRHQSMIKRVCIEMNICQYDESFQYKVFRESVDYRENSARISFYFTEENYLEVSLGRNEKNEWIVWGSTPIEGARPLPPIKSRPVLKE